MTEKILFIQGGGNGGYEADKKLADALKSNLGDRYEIEYPEMQAVATEPDYGWVKQILGKISAMEGDFILAGHSFGASMVLKTLSEHPVQKKIKGIFLIATPFWSGNEDWIQGIKLAEGFADKLPGEVPVFFYHAEDDEEIPFTHFKKYQERLRQPTFRNSKTGGHQLNNDLTMVAEDIKSLK